VKELGRREERPIDLAMRKKENDPSANLDAEPWICFVNAG